jgi:hypothetical protein
MGFFAEYFIEHSNWYAYATGTAEMSGTEDGSDTGLGADSADDGLWGGAPGRAGRNGGDTAPSGQADAQDGTERQGARKASRSVRRRRYEALIEPWVVAVLGVMVAVVFLLQQGLFVKTLFLLLFILWTWGAGKRFSLISTLIVMVGIVATNLLIPSGRVLFRLGPIVITEMALSEGLSKALTFEGLMYLSKAAIMPGLHFPGKFGAIIAEAFQYYDHIIEYRGKVHAKTAVRDIDMLLQKIWLDARFTGPSAEQAAHAAGTAFLSSQSRTRRSFVFALIIFTIVSGILIAAKTAAI